MSGKTVRNSSVYVPKSSKTPTTLANSITSAETTQLQKWLATMAMQNKSSIVFELEMWIRCFDRFFRIRNHPFSEAEMREVIRRDFSEELKIVRSVSLRMSQLCTDIITLDRTDSDYFGQYVESEVSGDVSMRLDRKPATQMTPEDSLSLLIESLADMRPILDSLALLATVNFQAFNSIGKLISRELQRCQHIAPLLIYKFKPEFDKIEHPEIVAIIKGITDPELRQILAQVFLEAFRMLRYLSFIGEDLKADRPLKRSLLIFTLIFSEIRILMDFVENKLLGVKALNGESRDIIDGCSYGMKMEMDKVFGKELTGFVNLRQAPPIYSKVENSHGLLRNCLQQTIIGIGNAFNSELTGNQIFPDYQNAAEQSRQLRDQIWRLICYLRYFEANVAQSFNGKLIDELVAFRDGAMKYLMFRDWEQLEKMHEDIVAAATEDEMQRILHLFATYLETLLGQVNMRAVLANETFEYPEIKVEIEMRAKA